MEPLNHARVFSLLNAVLFIRDTSWDRFSLISKGGKYFCPVFATIHKAKTVLSVYSPSSNKSQLQSLQIYPPLKAHKNPLNNTTGKIHRRTLRPAPDTDTCTCTCKGRPKNSPSNPAHPPTATLA